MRHQYVVTEPLDPAVGDDPDRPRPRPHHLLPPRGRRAARRRLLARPGHLGRRRPAGRAADALRRRHGALRRVLGGRAEARARRCATREIAKVVNGPEAFTPDGEFILGETEVGGLWVARGVLRARPRRRRAASARSWPSGSSTGGPSTTSRAMDIRRFGAPLRSSAPTRSVRRSTPTRATTTSSTRTRSARRAGRCGSRPPTSGCSELDASFGEKAGWERVELVRVERRRQATRRCARDGWAGRYWSPAIGAECLATRDARRRSSTSPRSPSSTSTGPARRGARPDLRQRGRPAGRRRRLHPAAQRRAAGSRPT